MAYLALDIQNDASHDSLRPPTVPSSFSEALDTVSGQILSLREWHLNIYIV
jgi:hypothetical protein